MDLDDESRVYNNALIKLKDHKLSLISDVFIVDKFTHMNELSEGRDKQWDNCSKNRLWSQFLWLQDIVGH